MFLATTYTGKTEMMAVEVDGVCLYIESSINSYGLNDDVFNVSKIEQIWAAVYFDSEKYLVGCLYRPSDFQDMKDIDSVFKQARDYVDNKDSKIATYYG